MAGARTEDEYKDRCRNLLAACQPRSAQVALWLVGQCLYLLRKASGISAADAGTAAGYGGPSVIQAIEIGTRPVRAIELAALCHLYKPAPQIGANLRALAANDQAGRWILHPDAVIPPLTRLYLGLEDIAHAIWQYQPVFVPGLLQTPGYAEEAFARCGVPGSVRTHRLRIRLERRQGLLPRQTMRGLDVVLPEPVLKRLVGTPAVMETQIRFLASLPPQGKVRVRVLPTAACPAVYRPITLFTIGDETSGWREDDERLSPVSRSQARRFTAMRHTIEERALGVDSSRQLLTFAADAWAATPDPATCIGSAHPTSQGAS
jgi:hypothetical protein